MVLEIFVDFLYYLKLAVTTEVLWVVLPLALATLIMVIYFEKYRGERSGWDTHVSNSLVLLFVALALLRFIYEMTEEGAYNYVHFYPKTLAVFILLVIGTILFFVNFEHLLPEKTAAHLSSPLTVNLIAFIMILFVYSDIRLNYSNFVSLGLLLIVLLFVFNMIRWPARRFFIKMKKMKEKEKEEEIINEKKGFKEKKKEVEQEEKELKKVKKELTKEEKKERKKQLKELEKEKKETIKLKKLVNKPSKKRSKKSSKKSSSKKGSNKKSKG